MLPLSRRILTGACLALCLSAPGGAQTPTPAATPAIDYRLEWFDVPMGNQDNRFFKTQEVAVHLMASSHPARMIAAFPGGNSGVGLWFKEDTHLEMAGQQATGGADFQQVEVAVRSNLHSVLITKVIMDNLRMLRSPELNKQASQMRAEYARTHGLPAGTGNNTFQTAVVVNERHIVFERKDFGLAQPYQCELILPPDTKVESDANGVRLTSLEDLLAFRVRMRVPFAALHPVPDEQLFTRKFLQFWAQRKSKAPTAVRDALRNFKFLAFREKFLAGSWQYLTYFGRDTAVTLSLLEPILSPQAIQDGLVSLTDRVSDGGKVAHEEEVGSLDELDRIREQKELDPTALPHLDHKMIDSDFFLPLLFADYARRSSPGAAEAFLARRNGRGETNRETLLRNFRRILTQARRFASAPVWQSLVALEPGVPVGNWRDSNTGIGNGRYPADVNLWLMPAALDAIAQSSGRFSGLASRSEIARLQQAWRGARALFEVRLSLSEMRERVSEFLEDSDRVRERSALLSQRIEPGCTVGDFLNGRVPASLRQGISFPAISLDAHGRRIPIMCSDSVFGLLFDRLSASEVKRLLPVFQLPFPLGLRSDIGLITANPAYDLDAARRGLFKSWAYHGTVVWVWPQAMLEMALVRQIGRFPELPELKGLLSAYSASRSRVGPLALSELYGYKVENGRMVATPYGVGSLAQNEANPIQLWSSVLPALYYAEARPADEPTTRLSPRPHKAEASK